MKLLINHPMKMYGGMDGTLHAFQTSAAEGRLGKLQNQCGHSAIKKKHLHNKSLPSKNVLSSCDNI
jgi:hypothetical protein